VVVVVVVVVVIVTFAEPIISMADLSAI